MIYPLLIAALLNAFPFWCKEFWCNDKPLGTIEAPQVVPDTENRCTKRYIREGNIVRVECFFESDYGVAVRIMKSLFLDEKREVTADYYLGFYGQYKNPLSAVNEETVELHFADGSSYKAKGCNGDASICAIVRIKDLIIDNPDVEKYSVYGGIGMKEKKDGIVHRLGRKRIVAVTIQDEKYPIDNETGEKIRADFMKLISMK